MADKNTKNKDKGPVPSKGYGALALNLIGAVAAVAALAFAASVLCSLNTGAPLPWVQIMAALNL